MIESYSFDENSERDLINNLPLRKFSPKYPSFDRHSTRQPKKDLGLPDYDISDILMSSMQPLEAIPATKRNYDIRVIQTPDKGTDIVFDKGDAIFSLGSLLPEGYTFVDHSEFECDKTSKQIRIPFKNLHLRTAPLSTLHEIWHAHSPDNTKEFYIKKLEVLVGGAMLDSMLSGKSINFEEIFDSSVFGERAKEERTAWAFALRQLRKLQDVGYDTFSDFGNPLGTLSHIDHCLSTYESIRLITIFKASNGFGRELLFIRRAKKPHSSQPTDELNAGDNFGKKNPYSDIQIENEIFPLFISEPFDPIPFPELTFEPPLFKSPKLKKLPSAIPSISSISIPESTIEPLPTTSLKPDELSYVYPALSLLSLRDLTITPPIRKKTPSYISKFSSDEIKKYLDGIEYNEDNKI